MIGALDPDEALWFGCPFEDTFEDVAGAVLVVVSADEEFRLGAVGQELVGVVSALRADGNSQANETFDAGVAAAGAQSHV